MGDKELTSTFCLSNDLIYGNLRLIMNIRSGLPEYPLILNSLVRGVRIIKVMGFFKGFQLFDNTVSVFGIIFSDPGFYTGGIKDGHGCKSRIKLLADWFGQLNQVVEHRL